MANTFTLLNGEQGGLLKLRLVDNGDGTYSFSTVPSSASAGGSLTDQSGEISTGGQAQQLMAANVNRRYLLIQNLSNGDLWFDFGVDAQADQPSVKLSPGAAFVMESTFVSTQALSIFGATTGQAFAAKEG